jgi:tRNA(Ile)-lysidine synthase
VGAGTRAFGPDWLAARLHALIPQYPDVSLCVALSGGVDSTALLAALAATRPRANTARALRAIHVDHGLHPRSKEWSEHCRAFAKQLRVPLQILRAKVDRSEGTSLEAAAREARYALLAAELKDGEVLLTAHHEDDQLETLLLQLLRGAGLAGLAAMPPMARFASGWLARPLLEVSRAEIEAWAREHSLTWVDDESNVDERLDRNYLRRQLTPLIRQRWPSAARTVARAARHIAEGQQLLDSLARADVERAADGAALSVKVLRTFSPERRRNALRYWIAQSGHTLPDTTRLNEIAGPMLDARPDANPRVEWGTTLLQREAGLLNLHRARVRESASAIVPEPESLRWRAHEQPLLELPAPFGKLELHASDHGPIDVDALPAELTIRWRRGGERLRPRAGGPSKSLKNLMQSARVPLAERTRVPLLFDAERLIAVGDFWTDASIQATASSHRRARIVWHRYLSFG